MLTPKQLSELTGVPLYQIYRWIARKDIESLRIFRGTILIPEHQADKIIKMYEEIQTQQQPDNE